VGGPQYDFAATSSTRIQFKRHELQVSGRFTKLVRHLHVAEQGRR